MSAGALIRVTAWTYAMTRVLLKGVRVEGVVFRVGVFSSRIKQAAMATRRTYGRLRLWGLGRGHDQSSLLSEGRIRMYTAEMCNV